MVEAKKLTLGPQGVLTQAERYCKGFTNSPFNFRGYRVPFLYSTNGEVIWYHDIRHELNRSHIVAQFHTPQALLERVEKDMDACWGALSRMPNDHPKLRPYQREANDDLQRSSKSKRRFWLTCQ